MLLSIQLKNFKRHEDLRADFTPGLNVIMGPNYSGKTTIIEALLFALFGVVALPLKADDLQRRNSRGMEVVLRFLIGEVEYELTRKKSTATLLRVSDSREMAKGNKPVAAELKEMLGMDWKRFLRLRYARQGETSALLTLGANDLLSIVEEAAGSEVISKVIAACADQEKATKAQTEILDDLPDLELLARSEASQQAELERAQANQTTAAGELDEAKEALATWRDYRDRLLKQRHLLQQVAEAGARLKDAQEAQGHLAESSTQLKSELKGIREALDAERQRKRQYEALQAAVKQAEDAWQRLSREAPEEPWRDELPQEAEQAREAAKAAQQGVEDALQALHEVQRQIDHLTAKIEAGVCQACQRPFDGAEATDEDKEQLAFLESPGLVQAQDALQEARQELQAAQQYERKLSTLVDAWQRYGERYEALQAELETKQGALKAFSEDDEPVGAPLDVLIEGLEEQERELQRRLAVFEERAKAVRAAEREHEVAEQRWGDHLTAEGELEDDGTSEEELAGNVQAWEEVVEDRARVLAECQTLAHGVQSKLQETQGDLTRAKEQLSKLEALQGRQKAISELKRFVGSRKDAYMGEVWASILSVASNLCSAVTGGEMTEIRRDGSSFTYVEGGEEMDIMASSGAQRSMAAIGVHLALSQMVQAPLPVVLLDEATSDMRDEISAPVCSAISSLCPQALLVSHREFDAEAAANVINLGV